MKPLTCRSAVQAASDQLAGLLSDAERGALEEHLAGCDSCSCLMDQLRSTVAVLASRPGVEVPESLWAMLARAEGGRGEALTAQLPHLYAVANALDGDAADDLVQETLTSALADPGADTTGSGLVTALMRLADERRPDVESPAVPTAGTDPDADEAELFYPTSTPTAPMPGHGSNRPWLGARRECFVLRTISSRPRNTVSWTQRSPHWIPSTPVSSPSSTSKERRSAGPSSSDLPSGEARKRLARARFKVRAALERYFRS